MDFAADKSVDSVDRAVWTAEKEKHLLNMVYKARSMPKHYSGKGIKKRAWTLIVDAMERQHSFSVTTCKFTYMYQRISSIWELT